MTEQSREDADDDDKDDGITSTPALERIYVGGLDPPRLCAAEILARLQKDVNIRINTVEAPRGKPYFHFTATTTSCRTMTPESTNIERTAAPSPTSSTALEIVSKQYNNVKWKGCRLQVQAAKPHFLQRLEEEREQQHCTRIVSESITTLSNDGYDSPPVLPRRLRIRRKHGEQAFHIDTRPWEVDSWYHFDQAKDKLAKKKHKHEEKTKEEQLLHKRRRRHEDEDSRKTKAKPILPWRHRTIHIRFSDDIKDDNSLSSSKHQQQLPPRQRSQLSHSGSSSSSSSDDENVSSSSSSTEDNEVAPQSLSHYAWSDDDDDDDNNAEGDKDDSDSAGSACLDENNSALEIRAKKGSSLEAREQHPLVSSTCKNAQISPNEKKKDYNWSSCSDSSYGDEVEDDVDQAHRNRPFRTVPQTEEFDAGLEDMESSTSTAVSESSHDDSSIHQEQRDSLPEDTMDDKSPLEGDVSMDVSSNLDILASLFPDVAKFEPAILVSDKDQKTISSNQASSGGGGPVGMVRYDPTAISSHQYEVGDEDDDDQQEEGTKQSETSGGASGSEQEEDAAMEKEEKEPPGLAASNTTERIYEQSKLEDVFRNVREGWSKNKTETNDTQSGGSGGFSFGFDLKPAVAEQPPASASGFSFGFSVPNLAADNDTSGSSNKNLLDASSVKDGDPDMKSETEPTTERRRRGIGVDVKTIELFLADFYAMNSGRAIMADPDGFRKDPHERAEWLKERQALTQDWKRKKKYAQSRNQKRMKLR